ncbi:hypothetical protein PGTUg99_034858 [Puccinia graminis f. sp. tritici]|uniref:Secreted protein n=1 Tax=Puccinia graminis f. sp. tritici TaxID=56615 RepID=A0A5B0PLI8_PUCGR|nr:hypothetical protein PGTUg99_034858 [Puccinia graminis f. sp. tritici]
MKPHQIIFGIFMAFVIPKPTAGGVACMGKVMGRTCGRYAGRIMLPKAERIGDCGDPSGCLAKRTKGYYICDECKSITVKNKRVRGGEYEACGHENMKLYFQGTVLPSQGNSEAASYE